MHKVPVIASVFLFSMALSTGAFSQGGYGGMQERTGPGAASPPTLQEPARMESQQPSDAQFNPEGIIPSGRIIGQTVQSTDGQKLGQIRGLMMDAEAGRIGYAVVSAGGVLGIGRRDHLVPWNAFRVDPQQGTYVLDVTPQQLREGPTAADVTTREEARRLHEYYGVAPYWEETLRMRPQQEPYPWEQPGGEIQERTPRTIPE